METRANYVLLGGAAIVGAALMMLFAMWLARAQWGVGGFEEYGYSSWKLGQLPATLQVSLKGQPVDIVLPKDGNVLLYACSVNAYGETSRPVTVRVKVVQKVEGAAPTAEPGAKDAAKPGGTAPGGGVWDEPAGGTEAKGATAAAEKKAGEVPAAAPEKKAGEVPAAVPAAVPEEKAAEAPADAF